MTFPSVIKNHKIATGIILCAIAVTSYLIIANKADNASSYVFTQFAEGDIESIISSTGTLNPVTEIIVGTQVSGTIEKVLVDFNDKVRKGQIIAVLDSALLQMALNNAEADSLNAEGQLEAAEMNYKQSEQLSLKGLISETDFQTVKTALKTAQAGFMNSRTALQRAVQNLNYSIIRSPINGTVTSRNIDPGQTVAASFSTPTLFTIAQDLSKMEITASVDESDIGQIKDGQNVRFVVQSYPDKIFTGAVKQIRLKPITTSNVVNYIVVVSAENKENLLLPGMTTTIQFIIEHKTNVLLVANAALRFQPTEKDKAAAQKRMQSSMPSAPSDNAAADWKHLWYLDKDGQLVLASVHVGISDGTNTEILGNQFTKGMKVIRGIEADLNTTPSKPASGGMRSPMM